MTDSTYRLSNYSDYSLAKQVTERQTNALFILTDQGSSVVSMLRRNGDQNDYKPQMDVLSNSGVFVPGH